MRSSMLRMRSLYALLALLSTAGCGRLETLSDGLAREMSSVAPAQEGTSNAAEPGSPGTGYGDGEIELGSQGDPGEGVVISEDGFYTPDPAALREKLGNRLEPLPSKLPYPPWNAPRPERVALGRLLFFDPILSGERDVACGTCHHPDLGWADGRQLPVGVAGGQHFGMALGPERVMGLSSITGEPVGLTPRNAPTVLNTGFNGYFTPRSEFLSLQFWDGRVEGGLEEQALKPPTSRVEMAGDAYDEDEALDTVLARLRANDEYELLFQQAFDDAPPEGFAIIDETVAMALASFQRELITPNAPYDRFIEGDDGALTPAQLRGLDLFFGRAACGTCHLGPMLSNYDFHVQGVAHVGPGRPKTPGEDLGRFEVTGVESDRYAFRTPSLRNVALTAPYMHNGALNNLHEVVEFYRRGGNDLGLDTSLIDPLIFPLELSDRDMDDLVAFMHGLTGDLPQVTVPERVPSGLMPVFGVAAEALEATR